MIALISSQYHVKNHLEEIIKDIPQVQIFDSNDEFIRNESNYNQFKQFVFVNYDITAYTDVKLYKYAREKRKGFSTLYELKNYLNQLKLLVN